MRHGRSLDEVWWGVEGGGDVGGRPFKEPVRVQAKGENSNTRDFEIIVENPRSHSSQQLSLFVKDD